MKNWVLWVAHVKSCLRISLVILLSLQLGIFPSIAQAQSQTPENSPNTNIPREVLPPDPLNLSSFENSGAEEFLLDPSNREFVNSLASFDQNVQNNTLPPSQFNNDPHKLANQRVEILYKGKVLETYSLNDFNIDPPEIGYSLVRVRYAQESKELIFEGVIGARLDGSMGDVVVRHIIPNFEISSFTKDLEILSILDYQGRLSVIDMGFALDQVFKSPIPVSQHIWKPAEGFLEKYQPSMFKLQYHQRVLRPFTQNELTEYSEIPKNSSGEIQITAGDLYLTFKDKFGRDKVLGFVERKEIQQHIMMSTVVLFAKGTLVHSSPEFLDLIAKKIAGLPSDSAQLDFNPISRNYIANISLNTMNAFKDRIVAIEEASERPHDQYTFEEMQQDHSQLTQEWNSIQLNLKEQDREAIGDLRDNYRRLFKKSERVNPFPKKETLMSRFLKNTETKAFKKLAAVSALGAGAAYFSFPFLHDIGLHGLDITALNWIYEYMYSDIMKDAYKYTLAKSMFFLIALVPATLFIMQVLKSGLKVLNKHVENKNTWWAHKVRDIFRNWKDLSLWQFIGTIGIRKVYYLSYPPIMALFKYALRQKNLILSLENGINPLSVVKKDSPVGKSLGLEKDQRVGINLPNIKNNAQPTAKATVQSVFKSMDQSQKSKSQIQSALIAQRKRVQHLSMLMATVIISEKYKIDPATLMMLMSDEIRIDELHKISQDPKTAHQRRILSEEVSKALLSENSALLIDQDASEIDPNEMLKYAQLAYEKAILLKNRPQYRQFLNYYYYQFKDMGKILVNNIPFINLGRQKLAQLKTVFVNQHIAKQGEREFYLDYPTSVLTYGMVGGRADRSDPQNLAAMTTYTTGDIEIPLDTFYMYTNPMHFYDMLFTGYSGFTSYGKLVLVFQDIQKSIPETAYLPKQFITNKSDERQQGLISAFKDWTKNILDFENSDIGGVFMKSYIARFATMQAGLILTLLFRLSLVPVSSDVSSLENIYSAVAGFFIYMTWAQWQYGYVEDTVREGNKIFKRKFDEYNSRLDVAKLKLDRGLKEKDSSRAVELIREGYSELLDLYKLQNPKALDQIVKSSQSWMKASSTASELNTNHLKFGNKNELSEKEQRYLGLVLAATTALNNNQQHEFESSMQSLKQVLISDQGLDPVEIEKLNARTLLNYSLTHPPVYTKENKLLFWLTQTASLVWATYLAIDLSIMIFNPDLLAPSSMVLTLAYSAALIPASLLLFGSRAWKEYNRIGRKIQDKIKSKTQKVKQTAQNTKSTLSSLVSWFSLKPATKPQEAASLNQISCSEFFK